MRDFLVRTWWRFDGGTHTLTDVIYSWFNLTEALAWFAIAIYVLDRYRRQRRTRLEIVYGVTFIVFGLSDIVESFIVQPWLIGAKGLIVIALVWMRTNLVRRHYVGYKF